MYSKILPCLLFLLSFSVLLPAQNCVVELVVLEVLCDDNDTPDDSTDDTFTFTVRAEADNGSPEGFFYFSSGNVLEGNGQYGENLTLGPVALANTPISLSLVDAADPSCNTSSVIDLPDNCGSSSGECGTGELVIALAQDTVCRGGGGFDYTVVEEPTGQPADYSLFYFLYAEPPAPNAQPLAVWSGTPPSLYNLTDPNQTYFLQAALILTPDFPGDCAVYSEVVPFFVSAPDLSFLPQEVLLCPGEVLTLNAINENLIGPPQEIIWQWDGIVISNEASIDIVDPGEYWLLVRDANGCAEDRNITVLMDDELPEFTILTSDCGLVAEACIEFPQNNNGFFAVWSNGSSASCTEFNGPGIYSVQLFNELTGCSVTESFTIESASEIEVADIEITDVSCDVSGRITYTVSGGEAPYSYTWSTGATTRDLENITVPGTYVVTITDDSANGCPRIQAFEVGGAAPLQLFAEQNTYDSCDEAGIIFLSVTGGTPPYSYAWNTGQTTAAIDGLTAGAYEVTVTDTEGCSAVGTYTIEAGLEVFVNGFTRLDCTTGTATFEASVEGDFSYAWSGPDGFSAETRTVTVSEPGEYAVVITSLTDPSCISQASTTISPAEFPVSEIDVVYGPECGVPPLLWVAHPSNVASYLWTLPSGETVENAATILAGSPGWYYLETDWVGQNCVRQDSVFISFTGADCATITGRLFADEGNCQLDGSEILVPGWRVQIDALNGSFTTVVFTDSNGNWSAAVPPGNYQVFALPYNNLYLNCSPPAQVNLPNANSTASVDVLMPWIEECPAMWTDLSIPFLRRCFPSQIFVSYCNDGSVVAEDARLVVQLDPFMEFLEADLAPALITADSLVFEVGDLAPFACGSFAIQVSISCEAELGQTHCASVHAYPDAPCPNPENWSGAGVVLGADCDGEEVQFQIKNGGDSPMTVPLEYIVIEDGIMMMTNPAQAPPLQPGESMAVEVPANGSTYHLFTNQEPNYPGASTPTLAVEGCGTNENGSFSTGFVNQFPLGDTDTPWRDEDCAPNVGAYDPNDKQGFPLGYGAERFIDPGTRLEYNLRFQNTGTDTAFTVVLRDTLAAELDLTTLRVMSASHAYRAELDTQRVLTVTFDNIFLPDSAADPLGSQGLLQFSIVAREDLEPGTLVRNRAGIYFDFNAPILTNTTLHTIGRDFVQVVSIEQIPNLLAQLEIYPNPSAGPTTVRITGGLPDRYQLIVTDVLGRDHLRTAWSGPTQELYLGHLPPGWYVVRLEDERGKIHRVGRVLLR